MQPGDGGALVNQLVLTKDAPLGDLVFGIDNSFASRAVDEGVVAPTDQPDAFEGALVPVDYGDVCINVDHAWFTAQGLAEPVTLEDLTKPEYKDLLVVPNAVTSSPGLSFLLATVGAFGEDGWVDYWKALKANGLKVADGWSDAYFTDFSGGGGAGPRPIVLSYASSPPSTVPKGGTEPTTGALLDTCFRQTEYAGVLEGAANPAGRAGAARLPAVRRGPERHPGVDVHVPGRTTATLPSEWTAFAPLATDPFEVSPADISKNREAWLALWSETVIG